MPGNWLSLKEAAEILGVHTSTVRNWSDQGILPTSRTAGGHRRFLRKELNLWISANQPESHINVSELITQALGFIRIQINVQQLNEQVWYKKLDEASRMSYAKSGRDLLQGLLKSQSLDDKSTKAEAHNLGVRYASMGRRNGLTIMEASIAYMFFRNTLHEAIYKSFETAIVQSPQAWGLMIRNITNFTDQILLSLLETYNALENRDK